MNKMIHCQNISKHFGSKQALNQVNIELDTGKPVALVGPNGAGKTTLFSIFCGYLQPSSGEVRLFGHASGSPALFGRVAALPQDALLDPRFTVAQQLGLYGRLQGMSATQQKRETDRVLELVGLSECLHNRPQELSHGMRKRITIAQALLGEPELVMLDEATAGLDPKNARQIRDLVADLSSEINFILSSHDLSELERLCASVLFLQNGQLVQQSVVEHASIENTLTLRMHPMDEHFVPQLSALEGMTDVEQKPQWEFILHYDPEQASDMHIRVLTLCHQNGWAYRQLIAGTTLESQLFD